MDLNPEDFAQWSYETFNQMWREKLKLLKKFRQKIEIHTSPSNNITVHFYCNVFIVILLQFTSTSIPETSC